MGMPRWLWRLGALLILGVTASAVVLVARTSPEPYSRAEIAKLVEGLNEAAAIGVPHGYLMAGNERAAHAPLLARVEAGEALDARDSAAYRTIYQNVLFENQRFLSRFDAELTVLDNVGPERANNVAGHGIAGHHDHHDVSGRRNFGALLESLRQLAAAGSTFERIRLVNRAQKDLVDLISHLGVAPHTISVAYATAPEPWPDAALGEQFEAMLKAYKDAQFAPVHSSAYWAAIDTGMARYADLILTVQSRVQAATSPLERRIAGRFLSPQTLAPPVDLNRAARRR